MQSLKQMQDETNHESFSSILIFIDLFGFMRYTLRLLKLCVQTIFNKPIKDLLQ